MVQMSFQMVLYYCTSVSLSDTCNMCIDERHFLMTEHARHFIIYIVFTSAWILNFKIQSLSFPTTISGLCVDCCHIPLQVVISFRLIVGFLIQ